MRQNLSPLFGALCGLTIVAIVAIDLFTSNLNVAVFFTIALVLAGTIHLRSAPWRLAALLVILTYAGYFLGPWPADAQRQWSMMFDNFRFFNRSLAAAVIVALTALWAPVGNGADAAEASSAPRFTLPRSGAFTGLVCGVLMGGIAIADLFLPAYLNLSILYAVPVLVAPWALSRRHVWLVLPLLVVLIWGGLLLDPAEWRVEITRGMIAGRTIATLAIVAALALHLVLRSSGIALMPEFAGPVSRGGLGRETDDEFPRRSDSTMAATGRMPTFIGIGAAKAGTTWIFRCLQAHPEIFFASVKETMFFHKGFYSEERLGDYREHFAGAGDAKAVGEFSTNYFSSEQAAQRIRKHLPDAKLILVLRNPIDQMYSHYWHLLRQNFHHADVERRTFEEAMGLYREHLIEPSLYWKHLQRWLELFPREQVHIILYDDIRKEPQRVMRDLYAFLGVDESFVPGALGEQSSNTRQGTSPRSPAAARMHASTYQFLVHHVYRHVRGVLGERRADALKESLRVRQIMEGIFNRPGYPPMKPETRESLRQKLAPEIQGVASFLGRDLSHWK
jgi:hypothetical protein